MCNFLLCNFLLRQLDLQIGCTLNTPSALRIRLAALERQINLGQLS